MISRFAEKYSLLTPVQIVRRLNDTVIGQDRAKKVLATAIYNHFKRLVLTRDAMPDHDDIVVEKSNILMIGPSGSGKTHLINTLGDLCGKTITHYDMTQVTQTGWAGENINDVIKKALMNNDMSVERTEKSIIFLDEFDKICQISRSDSQRDGHQLGSQQAVLKAIEGTKIFIKDVGQNGTTIDTTNILFICAGAFTELKPDTSVAKHPMGFFHHVAAEEVHNFSVEKQLLQYGIIPELLGRLPIVVELEKLTKHQMLSILKDVKTSVLKQFEKLFDMDKVRLEFTDAALEKIVDLIEENKLGARGLRNMLENILLETMYNLPSFNNVEKVTFEAEHIEFRTMPEFQYKSRI